MWSRPIILEQLQVLRNMYMYTYVHERKIYTAHYNNVSPGTCALQSFPR